MSGLHRARWPASLALLLAPALAAAQPAPTSDQQATIVFDQPISDAEFAVASHVRAECVGGLPALPGGPGKAPLPCEQMAVIHQILLRDTRYARAVHPALAQRAATAGLEGIYAAEELAIMAAAAGDSRSVAAFEAAIARRVAFPTDEAGLRDVRVRAARAALDFADLARAQDWAKRVAENDGASLRERTESLLVLAQIARFRDRREEALLHIRELLSLKPTPLGSALAAGSLQARIAADEFDMQGAMFGFMAGLAPFGQLMHATASPDAAIMQLMIDAYGMADLADSLSEILQLARITGTMTAAQQMSLLTMVDEMDKNPANRAMLPRGWKAPLLLRTALGLAEYGLGADVIAICARGEQALKEAAAIAQRANAVNLARCQAQTARFSGDLPGAAERIAHVLRTEPAEAPTRIDLLREAAVIASEAGQPRVATGYADQAIHAIETRLRQQAMTTVSVQRYRNTFLSAIALNWKASH